MRILDVDGSVLTAAQTDLSAGRIVEERVLVAHHEATAEIAEQSHWEPVPGRENVLKKVVDVAYQPARPAWNEYETIGRYKPYSAVELRRKMEQAADKEKAAQAQTLVYLTAPALSAQISDSDIPTVGMLMPDWNIGESYAAGVVVHHEDDMWRARVDSVASVDNAPGVDSSVWKRVGDPDPEPVGDPTVETPAEEVPAGEGTASDVPAAEPDEPASGEAAEGTSAESSQGQDAEKTEPASDETSVPAVDAAGQAGEGQDGQSAELPVESATETQPSDTTAQQDTEKEPQA